MGYQPHLDQRRGATNETNRPAHQHRLDAGRRLKTACGTLGDFVRRLGHMRVLVPHGVFVDSCLQNHLFHCLALGYWFFSDPFTRVREDLVFPKNRPGQAIHQTL